MADDDQTDESISYDQMGLDDRILKAISDLGWTRPTLIQEKAIPMALDGKDIVSRARTGSGKTAAFAIPMVHKVLQRKQATGKQSLRGIILTPTKELAAQARRQVLEICTYCSREITCIDLAALSEKLAQTSFFRPDIVVSTPAKLIRHLKSGDIADLKDQLEYLFVDEADLMFSLGYEADMKELLQYLPRVYQAFLTSATLNDDVKALKKLFLHNPITLKLEDGQLPSDSQLSQFQIRCEEDDKFVMIYALLKLKLIHGRAIIFVNSIDRCYKLKVFLEQFGIHSCVLNSELPASSRCHIVQQYNEGVYELIIATDEARSAIIGEDGPSRKPSADDQPVDQDEEIQPPKKKKMKAEKDQESGVSRGIDFHQVSNVINFDFPRTVDDYVHRVGRTARGWNRGSALSFATKSDRKALAKVRKMLMESAGRDVLKPYRFRMEELDGFRYRAKDVLNACSLKKVREARLKEISEEVLRSKRLKGYFAENPRDHQIIRHDSDLNAVKMDAHLTHVPEYIVPPTLRGSFYDAPKRRKKQGQDWKKKQKGKKPTNAKGKAAAPTKKFQKRKTNPLETFDAGGDSD